MRFNVCFVFVCYTVLSVPFSLVVTCWERADLLPNYKVVLLLWIIYVISVLFVLCFRARLFIDALWSTAGKG